MHDILVSVVIPAFNSEKYISECIDSVLKQTHRNLEIIIVDDGSTDNTAKIISGYKNERIKLFSQNNSGSAAARNYAVSKASGSWIAFIDSDDLWMPEKLQKQLEHCTDNVWSHTDLFYLGNVYPDHTRATQFTKKNSGNILESLLVENSIGTSSVVMKKEVFKEFGGFNTAYHALQDWDFWLRIASKYEISYYPEALVYYRLHSRSVSRNARNTLPYHLNLIDRVFSKDGIASELQPLKNNALSQSCQICSQISEQEKDYLFSIYCAAKSLIYTPLEISKYSRLVKIIIKSLLYYLKLSKT